MSESVDDSVQIEDGHHRACAYALAGRTALGFGEYVLVGARPRPRFGRLADLLARVERRA